MTRKTALLAAAAFAAAVFAPPSAVAQQPRPDAPALFGARERIEQISISPDRNRIVYLSPIAGRGTAIVIQSLDGDPRVVTRSSGSPERVTSCVFVTNDRVVCHVHSMTQVDHYLVPMQRLFAIDADGVIFASSASAPAMNRGSGNMTAR